MSVIVTVLVRMAEGRRSAGAAVADVEPADFGDVLTRPGRLDASVRASQPSHRLLSP